MKSLTGLIAFSVVVLFAFQNCNKAAFHSEMAGRNLDVTIEKLNVGELNVGAIQLFIPDSKVVTQSGSTYQLKYNKILEINLDSGEMIASNDVDADVGQYCVPAEVMTEMTDMLKSAQICREQQSLAAGTVCATVLVNPYAKLLTSGSDVNLTDKSNPCGFRADLCGDAKVQFQDMIKRMSAAYTSYTCSN